MDIEFFKHNGYSLTGISLPKVWLDRFREISNEIEGKALAVHRAGDHLSNACVVKDPVGVRILRFNELQVEYPQDVNQLLGLPDILRLIKALCGPKAIILQADLLYKHQHPHPVIKWHQGAPTDHEHHYLNMGIYLDDANLNDGCLRYVPSTQHQLQDIDRIEREFGWNPPQVVQVPARAGEILIQEMMVLHSSEPKRSPGSRRTIYVEIRSYEALLKEARYDARWLELRRFWMSEILKFDEEGVFTDEEKTFFSEGNELALQELMSEIGKHRNPAIPAVYNWKNVVGPNYPIPDDLK